MATWKHAERQIAKWLNGRRVPVSGRAGQPDVAHPWLSIEVKHRRRLPQWLTMALLQAEQAAAPDQLPIAVLYEAGERYGRSLVVLRLDAFEEWFGDILHVDTGTGRAFENL
jgi:hypothetical protein